MTFLKSYHKEQKANGDDRQKNTDSDNLLVSGYTSLQVGMNVKTLAIFSSYSLAWNIEFANWNVFC